MGKNRVKGGAEAAQQVLFRAMLKAAGEMEKGDPLVFLALVNHVTAEVYGHMLRQEAPGKLLETNFIQRASTALGAQLGSMTVKTLTRHMQEHLAEQNAKHIVGELTGEKK